MYLKWIFDHRNDLGLSTIAGLVIIKISKCFFKKISDLLRFLWNQWVWTYSLKCIKIYRKTLGWWLAIAFRERMRLPEDKQRQFILTNPHPGAKIFCKGGNSESLKPGDEFPYLPHVGKEVICVEHTEFWDVYTLRDQSFKFLVEPAWAKEEKLCYRWWNLDPFYIDW